MVKKIATLVVFIFFFFFYSFGYIDPGTGSYIFQILIAALVSLSFGVRIFRKNIKNFFKKRFSRDKKEPQ